MPILHGADLSPFVRKVRFALAIKQIAHEQIPVIPFAKTDEFLALSPLGKIPVYQDGDLIIPDSSVIIDYLENTCPDPSIYPKDAAQRAQTLFLEEYADTNLGSALGTTFFQRFVRKNFFKEEPDEAAIEKSINEELPPCLDYFEAQIGGQDYLVGGTLSIADISVASPFVNFKIGGGSVDSSRWPAMSAYLARIWGLPALKPIVDGDLSSAQAVAG